MVKHIEAPHLAPFNNLISFSILAATVLLLAFGLLFAFSGNFIIGPIMAIAGLSMIRFGLKTHSPDNPRQAGLLTFWDKPICIGGKTMVVGGTTIVMNYFPFFLDTVVIDMVNKDKDFPMKIMSEDNVQMEGKVSVTTVPKVDDLIDYLQAGKMDNILLQLDDIVFREVQRSSVGMGWREINVSGDKIEKAIDNKLEEGSFGIEATKIQVRLLPPESVVKDAEQKAREKLQREGEKEEYRTTIEAAEEMLQRLRTKNPGTTTTLEDCIAEIKHERQIRNGQSFRIDGTGRTIISTINVGSGFGEQKKKKGD